MTNDKNKPQVNTGKALVYTQNGIVPKGKQPNKKSITLLDILLGRK